MVNTVQVGPFEVADVSRDQLQRALVAQLLRTDAPVRVFALHVGGLNKARDPQFVSTLNRAEWLYADGASVVLLARAAGAKNIQRAPTTDLAHVVIDALADALGREVRIALVGGPPGLAEKAAGRLEQLHRARVVVAQNGYQDAWVSTVRELGRAHPDVVFIGLGMPAEARWVSEHLKELPPSLVMTCGGWFGFLAGQESRAPAVVQRHGLEWLWRLMQSPRLGFRYAAGLGTTVRVLVSTLRRRWSGAS